MSNLNNFIILNDTLIAIRKSLHVARLAVKNMEKDGYNKKNLDEITAALDKTDSSISDAIDSTNWANLDKIKKSLEA